MLKDLNPRRKTQRAGVQQPHTGKDPSDPHHILEPQEGPACVVSGYTAINLFVQQTASSSTYCLLLRYFDAFEDKGLVGTCPEELTRFTWHHFLFADEQ